MSQLIAMIVRAEDLSKPEVLTELWRQPLPVVTLEGLAAEHYLDGLEETMTEVGWTLMRSWLRPHRGISQEKLPWYLGFFEFVHNARVRGKGLLKSLLAILLQ